MKISFLLINSNNIVIFYTLVTSSLNADYDFQTPTKAVVTPCGFDSHLPYINSLIVGGKKVSTAIYRIFRHTKKECAICF